MFQKLHSQTFDGNYDRSTVVTRILYEGIQAQFIRIYPTAHYDGSCMRLEIYGLSREGNVREVLKVRLLACLASAKKRREVGRRQES